MAERVDVVPISDEDLRRLAPDYDNDMRPFLPSDAGPFRIEAYLKDEHDRYAIRADDALAGFAIVSRGDAFRDPEESVWWMDEFFVESSFRRAGVGSRAATLLFRAHPGTWEVGQLSANVPAQAFWRKVIGSYTEGRFEEFDMDDERWCGPVQYFRTT